METLSSLACNIEIRKTQHAPRMIPRKRYGGSLAKRGSDFDEWEGTWWVLLTYTARSGGGTMSAGRCDAETQLATWDGCMPQTTYFVPCYANGRGARHGSTGTHDHPAPPPTATASSKEHAGDAGASGRDHNP